MIEDIVVRPMTAADIGEVLAIERDSETAPHWEFEKYFDSLRNDPAEPLQRRAFVADSWGNVVGFAVLRLLSLPDGVEAELESIVVVTGHRGKGIGGRLLRQVLALCKDRGATHFDLEVRASNATAIRFYGRHGFSVFARRRRYYADPEEDAVLMRINL